MKNLFLCLSILFVLNSCSTDDAPTGTNPQNTLPDHQFELTTSRLGDVYPANSDNPYDYVGMVHNEILSAYYEGTNLPSDVLGIAARVKTIASTIPGFSNMKEPFGRDTNVVEVQHILSHPNTCITDVIQGTGMSEKGKSSLNAFVLTAIILSQKDLEYVALYDFVCKFESDVLADPMLTDRDKRIMLKTAAITRYTVHMKKKRPKKNTDPDWDIFIANMVGGSYGAESGDNEAITTALTAGIAQNL